MKRVRNKKEGKFSIPAFIIPVLDYVYYRGYGVKSMSKMKVQE